MLCELIFSKKYALFVFYLLLTLLSLLDAHLASMNYNAAKVPLGKSHPLLCIPQFHHSPHYCRKARPLDDIQGLLRPKGVPFPLYISSPNAIRHASALQTSSTTRTARPRKNTAVPTQPTQRSAANITRTVIRVRFRAADSDILSQYVA
jgi:hypothetical protein